MMYILWLCWWLTDLTGCFTWKFVSCLCAILIGMWVWNGTAKPKQALVLIMTSCQNVWSLWLGGKRYDQNMRWVLTNTHTHTHTAVLFSIINQCTSCSLPLSQGESIQECCMWMKVWQTHTIIYSATTACSHKNHWDASLSTDHTVRSHSICPLGEHGQAHTFFYMTAL